MVRAALLVGALLAGLTPAGAQERAALARPNTPVPADLYPIATEARLGGDANRTRLVVDLSRPIEIAAFTLADPYRIVIDLPQVTFQLPGRTGESGRGLVKAFRFGLVMQGGSRIVIDAAGPVRIDKAFALEASDGQPARLVLELISIDRDTFLHNLAVDSRSRRTEPRRSDRDAAPKSTDSRPLLVLDPGHGGLDT